MTSVSEPDGGSGPPVMAATWELQASGKFCAAALAAAAPETPRQTASMDKAIFRMLFLPRVIFIQTWAWACDLGLRNTAFRISHTRAWRKCSILTQY